jgi:hypothetical protein
MPVADSAAYTVHLSQTRVCVRGEVYEKFYDDGGWSGFPPADEAEVLQAEQAFREAFVETAHAIVGTWRRVDTKAIEMAWRARDWCRHLAEVRVPMADYCGVTDRQERRRFRGKETVYRLGHRIVASRLRGIHHAMVFVELDWGDARRQGIAWETFAARTLAAWVRNVDAWAARPIRVGYCSPPPRPLEPWPRVERQLVCPPTAGISGSPQRPSDAQGAGVSSEACQMDSDPERTAR